MPKQSKQHDVEAPAFDLEQETHATLQRALNLLSEKGWTSGLHCLNSRGQKVHHSESPAKYDLYGAVLAAARRPQYDAEQKDKIESFAFALLKAEMPTDMQRRGIVTFNVMARDVEQVLDLLRNAAKQIGPALEERNAIL